MVHRRWIDWWKSTTPTICDESHFRWPVFQLGIQFQGSHKIYELKLRLGIRKLKFCIACKYSSILWSLACLFCGYSMISGQPPHHLIDCTWILSRFVLVIFLTNFDRIFNLISCDASNTINLTFTFIILFDFAWCFVFHVPNILFFSLSCWVSQLSFVTL